MPDPSDATALVRTNESDGNEGAADSNPRDAGSDPVDRGLGSRGRVLVGLIVVAFVVAPALIVLFPPGQVPFFVAYLVIPLGIAVVLGAAAVWAAIG